MPEPKAKVKPKGGRQPKVKKEAPSLPEYIARRVKQKQIKQRFRQTTEADAPLRPCTIVLEDLNVEGMKRNRKLARSISDVGMGEFRRQVTYKTF